MKIYLVTLTRPANYDEYDGLVIIAQNKKNARSIALKDYDFCDMFIVIEKIGLTKIKEQKVVLESYNKG